MDEIKELMYVTKTKMYLSLSIKKLRELYSHNFSLIPVPFASNLPNPKNPHSALRTPHSYVPCPLTPETGFTLLELLCSITILSMVLVSVYGVLNMGSRAWEKGERDIEKIQRMRVIMDLLGREIKSTFPYEVTPSKLDTHKKFYAFEGKKDSISFVSTVPLRGGKKGLSWLTFLVEEDKGLVVVERDALRTDIFKERDFVDKDEMEVLDEHVTHLRLEYYELKRGRDDGEGQWKERWDAEKEGKLPYAVKIELTFREKGKGEDDEEEFKRELLVPIMIYNKKIRVRS
jgi:general secretion pathway protein J